MPTGPRGFYFKTKFSGLVRAATIVKTLLSNLQCVRIPVSDTTTERTDEPRLKRGSFILVGSNTALAQLRHTESSRRSVRGSRRRMSSPMALANLKQKGNKALARPHRRLIRVQKVATLF